MDEELKPWWLSRGVLGGAASVIAGLAGIVGYSIDVAAATQLFVDVAALGAGIVAIVGRVKATQIIQPKK